MLNFSLMQDAKILFGVGSCSQIAEILQDGGYKNPLVAYDKGVKAAGVVDKILKSLDAAGIKYCEYDEVIPDPPDDMIEKGFKVFTDAKCDCAIAVGGGSSIDTAKAINFMSYNPPPILQYVNPAVQTKRALGLISIPTTAGTGSELSDGMVITDSKTGEKIPIRGPDAMSEYIIIDPELMVGMPPELTMFTGLDAMAHAVESYTTILGNLMKDQIAEKVIEIVYKWLPVAVKDGKNIEARSYMGIAASLGGFMLAQAGTHVGHTIAHMLGARFHVPHGAGCALAEPHCLEINAIAVPEKTRKIGELMGAKFTGKETPEEIGAITRDAFIKFRDADLGMKPASAFNMDKSLIGVMADVAVNDVFVTLNPLKLTRDNIVSLLDKSMS